MRQKNKTYFKRGHIIMSTGSRGVLYFPKQFIGLKVKVIPLEYVEQEPLRKKILCKGCYNLFYVLNFDVNICDKCKNLPFKKKGNYTDKLFKKMRKKVLNKNVQ